MGEQGPDRFEPERSINACEQHDVADPDERCDEADHFEIAEALRHLAIRQGCEDRIGDAVPNEAQQDEAACEQRRQADNVSIEI
jgi:hypothetical protein